MEAIAALSVEDKATLREEALAVTRLKWRGTASIVDANMVMVMAERMGCPVEPWRASAADLVADEIANAVNGEDGKPKKTIDLSAQQTTLLGKEFDALADKSQWMEQAKTKLVAQGVPQPKDGVTIGVARGIYVNARKTQAGA